MSEIDNDRQGVRLQKVMAAGGVGSRRACEELIAQGRVEVDGRTVVEQGMRVDPETVVVKVDGMRLQTSQSALYLAVNKPRGMVSTMSDPEGRPCLTDLPAVRRDQRLFHVGRLDADSEGLLLLTNDGELAHRLTHPSFGVRKTYLAEVSGAVAKDLGKSLRAGVELDDGVAKVDSFRVVGRSGGRAMVEVVIHEGRKHIVRRMLASVDLPVHRLVRTQIGPVRLGDLRPGKTRPLNRAEVSELFGAVDL
ncbi:MAG: pseudouridine synthase [Acidothermaceae bacterium]